MDPRQFPSVNFKQVTLTPGSVAANTIAEQDFTVEGVPADNHIYGYEPPDFGNATGVVGVRVKSKDTIAIRFVNTSAGALTPGAGIWRFWACKPR